MEGALTATKVLLDQSVIIRVIYLECKIPGHREVSNFLKLHLRNVYF